MSEVTELPQRRTYSREVAATVRAELARAQVRQVPVARALGLSQASVSARIRGDIPWSLDELVIVAGLLDVRLATLLPGSTEPTASEREDAGMGTARRWAGGPSEYAPRDSNPEPSDSGSVLVSEAVVVDLDAYRAARLAVGA